MVDKFISEADALLKQHIAGYEAAFPRYALDVEDTIAEADKVVVRFTFRATYGGGFMDIPAKGQQVATPGIIQDCTGVPPPMSAIGSMGGGTARG